MKNILGQPESRILEFKRELPRNRKNILKTITAFANGSGGILCIGIDDKQVVVGIQDDPFSLEETLSSLIYDSISPVPNVFFQTSMVKSKVLFLIKVVAGRNKPYFIKKLGPEKGSYIRIGSTNRQADAAVLAELMRQARNISLDGELDTTLGCERLDYDVLNKYIEWRRLEIEASLALFIKIKAACQYNQTCHPTVGGMLLFSGKLPNRYFCIFSINHKL